MNARSVRLLTLFTGTVRRQLIWGVALVHAVMMSLFVYDLSERQHEFLIESQVDQATSLAHNLSLIAVTPLLSADLAGLQELTMAISRYPGVTHVFVAQREGKILAHGEAGRRGQYMSELPQWGAAEPHLPQVLVRTRALADVLVPVVLNRDLLGWVRVGVSQRATATKLDAITQSGLLYTALAIVAGVLLAWLLASRLTQRFRKLAQVADAVTAGSTQVRALTAGVDEISHLARAFNFMLDALALRTQKEQDLQGELQAEKELAQITLASIGDGVITTDPQGRITFLNTVAQDLTGWKIADARGCPVADVFQLFDSASQAAISNPAQDVLATGLAAESASHAVLFARYGLACPVESLATPIFSTAGALLGCVLVFRDVSEKHRVQDRLQWQAGHDALTSLPNRVLLADRFARALDKAKRNSTLLAVCMLDLDQFKPVNDTYGHDVGDELLIAVTSRLSQELRDVDTLSRLGGDEFVLLFEDLDDATVLHRLLERILRTLSEPFHIRDHRIKVSASMGVTMYPQDDSDADTLMRHADQAMYVAKQTGRNRYHRFDVVQDRKIESTHQTLERVRQAISRDELCLHYQPKVNLRTGEVKGFEALLRWEHPQDGMIPPLSFLPLVEQTDVIVDIGEWVLERALRQLSEWDRLGKAWPVSVNMAARHFQRDDFLVRLQALLARYPEVSPALLEFEILESVALGDIHAMNALIASCRALGIGFSLDDFGTGYSSLSYLKRIPVQTLKIDQSFVRDMLEDQDDLALVESVINIAKLFHLSVIAEGVESVDQGVLLLRLGCDMAQGYGIARPMPPAQVPDWVTRFRPDAQWNLWADVKWEIRDLPLLVAPHDHVTWIKRVVSAVEGMPLALTDSQLIDPHQCRFGHWLDGHGRQRYAALPEFAALTPVHQRVHELGHDIIQLHNAGDALKARLLCPELLALKDQLLRLLDDLQRAALLVPAGHSIEARAPLSLP